MGRYSYSNRTEADGLKKIEIIWLNKNHYLNGWRGDTLRWTNRSTGEDRGSVGIEISTRDVEKYIHIHYTQTDRNTGEKKEFDYKMPLVSTPCHFGGKRYWFLCNLIANGKYCGKRVGVLYGAGDYFGCRHCYNLTYNSRKLSGLWKSAGKVISMPELEELEEKIKHRYYAGKMTKRYRNYLKKEQKAKRQMMIVTSHLGGYET